MSDSKMKAKMTFGRWLLTTVCASLLVISSCSRPSGGDDVARAGHEEAQEEGEESEEKGASDRTTIEAAVAEESGIKTQPIGPGIIRDEHDVQGILTVIEGRHSRVIARFPGQVRSVGVSVGDKVSAGQTLAVVESNVSLSEYAITAPFSGTVLARNVAVGDLASESPLFEIADLTKLWVDMHLFGSDAEHLGQGQHVAVERLSDKAQIETAIDRVLPGTATASQSTVARATISNADGRWRPGSAVRARVSVAETKVPLAAPLSALQTMNEKDVIFTKEPEGDEYRVRQVELGPRDGRNVQILSGVEAGEHIVTEQSYLIKANIEKSSVEEG